MKQLFFVCLFVMNKLILHSSFLAFPRPSEESLSPGFKIHDILYSVGPAPCDKKCQLRIPEPDSAFRACDFLGYLPGHPPMLETITLEAAKT